MSPRIFFSLKLLSLLILLGGFLFVVVYQLDPDLGWHLSVGKWIFENRAVPQVDIYSHTMPGFPWIDHEWLFHVSLWWLQDHQLWWLVIAVFTIITFYPFAVWIYRSETLLDLWMILLAGMFMLRIIGVRPQMISFFLFFIWYEILSRRYYLNAESGKDFSAQKFPEARLTLPFLLLPLLFGFWANLHAGFVLALGLLACLSIFYSLWQWRTTGQFPWRTFGYDTGIFTLSALATLANPSGWRVYEFVFHALRSSETAKYIIEWQSVLAFPLFSTSIFIALTLLFLLQLWREYPPHKVFVVSLLLLFFLKSVRNGPLFFVAAIPAAIQGVRLLVQKISTVRNSAGRPFAESELTTMRRVGIGLVSTGLIGFLYVWSQFQNPGYPVEAAKVLQEYARQGDSVTLFNTYGWGGYLIWNVPEVKVFIDGRMDHWVDADGNSAMREYVAAIDGTMPVAWKEVFKKHRITAVLVNNVTPPSPETLGRVDRLRLAVRSNPILGSIYRTVVSEMPEQDFALILPQYGWKLLFADPTAVLLICDAGDSCYQ